MSGSRYVLELETVRVRCEEIDSPGKCSDAKEAAAVALAIIAELELDADVECFGWLATDQTHAAIAFKVAHIGTKTQAPIDPAKFWREILATSATAVVVFHTHPSGQVEPSTDDLRLTSRLIEGGLMLGLEVHDHLVLAPSAKRWRSIRESNGLLWTRPRNTERWTP